MPNGPELSTLRFPIAKVLKDVAHPILNQEKINNILKGRPGEVSQGRADLLTPSSAQTHEVVSGVQQKAIQASGLPPEIAARVELAERAGFSPEHPYTQKPRKVFQKVKDELVEPKEPVGMAGWKPRLFRRDDNNGIQPAAGGDGEGPPNEPLAPPAPREPEPEPSRAVTGEVVSAHSTPVERGERRENPHRKLKDLEKERRRVIKVARERLQKEAKDRGEKSPESIDFWQVEEALNDEERGQFNENNTKLEAAKEEYEKTMDYLASPELGEVIAEEIMELEGVRAAGGYERVDWAKLDGLYKKQIAHIEAARVIGVKAKKDLHKEESEETKIIDPDYERLKAEDLTPLAELIATVKAGRIPKVDQKEAFDKFNKDVDVWFAEAKKAGLLNDLDDELRNAYERDVIGGIHGNFTLKDIRNGVSRLIEGIEPRIQGALDALMEVVRFKISDNSENARFLTGEVDARTGIAAGVWDLYAELAKVRLIRAVSNKATDGSGQPAYEIENEFRLDREDTLGARERYWRSTQGIYTEVTAQTEEQFIIAADSYIANLQEITAAPDKIFQEATQFIDVLRKSDGAQKMKPEFLKNLIFSLEARIGVFGADHANELYHGDQYKQFMDFIAKDGNGPARWLELPKLLDGNVAAALWKMDNDPRFEMLFALHGSRGQLANDSHTQRTRGNLGLYYQIEEVLVKEMMGTRIIDNGYISELTKRQSGRDFVEKFDGLYEYGDHHGHQGDANIKIYQKYGEKRDEVPKEDRDGWRLGKIQHAITPKAHHGRGLGLADLSEADQEFYKHALEKAQKAVHIAMEMYGALGEKSKRGGGVFKVRRKDSQGRETHQDFISISQAEKFVQFAETMTKMKYANSPAKERKKKVTEARDRAIRELTKNGFQAKLYEDDNNRQQMMLKKPKSDGGAVESVHVDFHTATHHVYGDWTSHTYWSYQEEDRSMLLSPTSFDEARKIKAGLLRPEDATTWANQLLILDPTLKRVRKFKGKHLEERERKLTMAAVEDSYQSHWRIGRELHRAFFPKHGTPAEEIGIYYGLQDFGGYRKMIESFRAQAAEDPERFARRGRRLIPDLHIPYAAASEMWGVGSRGVMGVMGMMDAPIYRAVGTMALDKFAAQSEVAGAMHSALFGSRGKEGYTEGLLLKPTNNSDKLVKIAANAPEDGRWESAEAVNDYGYALIESLGRLKEYEKWFTVMETAIRNASGAQWLEEVDILVGGQFDSQTERLLDSTPDISKFTAQEFMQFMEQYEAADKRDEEFYNRLFNKDSDKDRGGIDEGRISINTGSGRHSSVIFHETFGRFLVDQARRGGGELYPSEVIPYSHIFDTWVQLGKKERDGIINGSGTIWDFILTKFVPT